MLIGPHDQMPDFVSQDMSEERDTHFGDSLGSEKKPVVHHRNHRNRIEGVGKCQGTWVSWHVSRKPDLDSRTIIGIHSAVRLPLQSNSDRRKHSGRLFRRGEPDKGRDDIVPRRPQRDIGASGAAR